MLLEQEDIDPDQAEHQIWPNATLVGAERRYEEVVKMLLEREDVNPNTIEKERGCTPLSWAAGRRETRVVKVLWTRNRAERRSRGRLSAGMGGLGTMPYFSTKIIWGFSKTEVMALWYKD